MKTVEITSWIGSEQRATATRRNAPSPFDGSLIGIVHESGPLDFVQALPLAKKAQENFEKVPLAERALLLERIAERLQNSEKEIARASALFEGWSAEFALTKIVRPVEALFRRLAGELKLQHDEDSRQPTGLLSIIAPAPMSFRFIGERLAPALAAGNAVLVKVPSGAPVTANLWGQLLKDAEVPVGLVSLLVGRGSEIGPLFASHPSLRAVSFGGRPSNAAAIARAAGESLKKAQISGGVKNSLLLLPETDPAHWPEIMNSVLIGQGRLGFSLSRIFVTETQTDEFFAKLEETLKSLEPLRSPEGSSPWTPFADGRALEALEKTRSQITADQGRFIASSRSGDDFHQPVLFVKSLTNCSTLQLEETAAPVVIVNSVKYAHEMAKWNNTSDYGLCASVWGPEDKARRLGAKLQAGQVWINGWLKGDTTVAGWKKSFFGIPDPRWDGRFYSDVKILT